MNSTGISIGSDPELICSTKDTNEPVDVSSFLSTTRGEFGTDGHRYIAEIRPDAAVYPRDFLENIRKTLSKGYPQLKNFNWSAGPWILDKPLGGHLHFGIQPTEKIIDALDNQLAIILALIEPREQAIKRRNTVFVGAGGHVNNQGRPYGNLRDYKPKTYGFEWRTPSSYLVSPGTSLGLITIAKAIVFEELEKGSNSWSSLSASIRNNLKFKQEDFRNCNRELFLEKFNYLWPLIKKMKYFNNDMEGKNLWANVCFLKKIIQKGGFKVRKDIKKTWKINDESMKFLPKKEKLSVVRPNFTFNAEDYTITMGEINTEVRTPLTANEVMEW